MIELAKVQEIIKGIVKKQLGKEAELHEINSLQFIRLVVTIEAEFDIEFDDSVLSIDNFESIEKLAQYVVIKGENRNE